MKVAVIDDGIQVKNALYIKTLGFDLDCLDGIMTERKSEVREDSHGTIVAEIIRSFDDKAEIGSIRIIHSDEHGGTVQDLAAAIQWCIENEIDLIHMSIGTTNWNDFEVLESAVQNAAEKVHMLAANHNAGRLSAPAAFQGVWSVSWKDGGAPRLKRKGSQVWNVCSNLVLPEILQDKYGWYIGYSNSFQAAAVTGCLLKGNVFEDKVELDERMLNELLEAYSVKSDEAEQFQGEEKSAEVISGKKLIDEVPVIWIRPSQNCFYEDKETYVTGVHMLLKRFCEEGYYAAGMTDLKEVADIYNIYIDYTEMVNRESILYSLGKFRPDVLLIFSDEYPLEEADVCMELKTPEECMEKIFDSFI